MTIPSKVLKFLNKAKVKYEPIEHRIVYTAFDKAQTLKVPKKIVGKTLIIKKDEDLILVLISADKNLDTRKLKKIIKNKKLVLASEGLIKKRLKGVKVGAVPPFGSLWNIPTFVDKSLMKEKEVILNSGNYNFSIKIQPQILKNLIPKLTIGSFGKKK